MNRQLFRSRDDRMIAGVAGGLAELWDADPSVIRFIWVVLVPFTGGFALLAYVIMALVVPEEDAEPSGYTTAAATGAPTAAPLPGTGGDAGSTSAAPASGPAPDWRAARRDARAARRAARRDRRAGPSNAGIVIGALLVIAGVYALIREYIPAIDLNWLWPVAVIALGVVILMAAVRRPPADPAGPAAPG